MAAVAPVKTLVLTSEAITRLAGNSAVVAEFPFLGAFSRPPRRSSCCPGASAPRAPDAKAAIAAVFALPPGRQRKFKDLLNVTHVTGHVVRSARVVKASF